MVICKLVKKSAAGRSAAPKVRSGRGDPAPASYVLTDNEDGTITVNGANKAGDSLDISGVATLSGTSSDAAVASVDPPSGMTAAVHGLKPGTATITLTATWNDGSVGPFTIDVPVSIAADPAVSGLAVNFGPPTIRP